MSRIFAPELRRKSHGGWHVTRRASEAPIRKTSSASTARSGIRRSAAADGRRKPAVVGGARAPTPWAPTRRRQVVAERGAHISCVRPHAGPFQRDVEDLRLRLAVADLVVGWGDRPEVAQRPVTLEHPAQDQPPGVRPVLDARCRGLTPRAASSRTARSARPGEVGGCTSTGLVLSHVERRRERASGSGPRRDAPTRPMSSTIRKLLLGSSEVAVEELRSARRARRPDARGDVLRLRLAHRGARVVQRAPDRDTTRRARARPGGFSGNR